MRPAAVTIQFSDIMLLNITTLPSEIMFLVMENLPDSASLFAAILSCHQVYNSVKYYVHSILKMIIISQINLLHNTTNRLHAVLRTIHPAPFILRDLRDGVRFLTQTLIALEGVACGRGDDLRALELPLQQCNSQCIFITLKFAWAALDGVQLKGDPVTNWVNMIFRYNLTFRVVLGKARLQEVSIAGNVLEQYRNMIENAKLDLTDEIESPIISERLQEQTCLLNRKSLSSSVFKSAVEL
ncbi:hypothetical protein EMCG_07933 [[Emmonsia] crescens]|uniref:Azaphilone pigments biosynthesis cluster protein L N-terminal domain-containing protein n=1 Tax=[Emmonsia] crescens TaxID=73230 RepID=A0A0G2I6S0_9EURO|nr:hypothetical protein EMCG_07933 [Emmonsia crescens UAMH 3008]